MSQESGLPADVFAEKVILGAIILDNEQFYDDSLEIEADDFSLDSNRRIFLVMNEILFGAIEGIRNVDIVTLTNVLGERKWIQSIGGVSYLASLTEGLPMRPVIDEYVRIIKEKSRLRRLMAVFATGLAKARMEDEKAADIQRSIETELLEISSRGDITAVDLGSVAPTVEARVESERTRTQERTALDMTWGLDGLDRHFHGLFKGELSVIGGESGGGKSSLLLQILLENAKEGTPVCLFSMEMTKEQVASRAYAQLSPILSNNMMRDPRLMNPSHLVELRRVREEMSRLPFKIDETTNLRIDRLIARMRMMRRKFGTRLFGVDYLQLIKLLSGMQHLEAFTSMIFALRDFHKLEPDCSVVALSQYSIADKMAKSRRRTKDSLYGGAVIHQAAQNVLMVSIEDAEEKDAASLLDVEIKLPKIRDGRRGKVVCQYDQDHLKFCYAIPPLRGM